MPKAYAHKQQLKWACNTLLINNEYIQIYYYLRVWTKMIAKCARKRIKSCKASERHAKKNQRIDFFQIIFTAIEKWENLLNTTPCSSNSRNAISDACQLNMPELKIQRNLLRADYSFSEWWPRSTGTRLSQLLPTRSTGWGIHFAAVAAGYLQFQQERGASDGIGLSKLKGIGIVHQTHPFTERPPEENCFWT